MGKIIPKDDAESRKFWDSVAEVAKEVETWPAWKKGGPSPLPFYKPSPQEASAFKRTFSRNLWDYWDVMLGFDIVKFDDSLGVPDGQSCKDYINELHGEEAVKLIQGLLSACYGGGNL